jgi:hypothetical protein
MNELLQQITSLLKKRPAGEIVLQETHTPDETRALEKMGRVIGEFLKD